MAVTRVPSLDLLRSLRSVTSAAKSSTTSHKLHTSSINTTRTTRYLLSSSSIPQTKTRLYSTDRPSSSSPSSKTTPLPAAASTSSASSGTTTSPANSAINSVPRTPRERPITNPYAPQSHDRGPTSKEDTQTDFGAMDIFNNIPNPATSIDACTPTGFHLDNGIKTSGGAALIVAGGEAWAWKPWLGLSPSASPGSMGTSNPTISTLLDARRGILTIPTSSLGILSLLHPKPDLLIFGTGSKLWMLAPESKKYIMEELGMRVDVMDTANATAAYNLLAKERGTEGGAGVGGMFLPVGWKGPETSKPKSRVGSLRR